jgi:hypothetical protein
VNGVGLSGWAHLIPGFLRHACHLAEWFTGDPFCREDLICRRLWEYLRYIEELVALQVIAEPLSRIRLALIIALIRQLSPHHGDRVLQIQPLWQHRRGSQQWSKVGKVRGDRVGDAGELDLDRHGRTIRRERSSMYLADRRGGDGRALKFRKEGLPVGAKLLRHHFLPMVSAPIPCTENDETDTPPFASLACNLHEPGPAARPSQSPEAAFGYLTASASPINILKAGNKITLDAHELA